MREMPELRALASYYAGKGGALWVAEAGGLVVGMIGDCAALRRRWEICGVYMLDALRGGGLGTAICLRLRKRMRERPGRRGWCCGATRGSTARTGSTRSAAMCGTGRSACCTTSRTRWSLATQSRSPASRCWTPRLLHRLSGGWPRSCAPASMRVRRCRICRRLALDVARVASGGESATDVAAGTRVLLAAWRRRRTGRHGDAGICVRRRTSRIARRCRSCWCIRTRVVAGVARALMRVLEIEASSRRQDAVDARHAGGRCGGAICIAPWAGTRPAASPAMR